MPYESFVSPEISLIIPYLRTVTRILCVETNPTLLCWQRRRMRRSVRPTLSPVPRRDALDARTKHSSEFLTIPLGLQVSEWCLYNYRTRSLSLKLGHCLFYLTIICWFDQDIVSTVASFRFTNSEHMFSHNRSPWQASSLTGSFHIVATWTLTCHKHQLWLVAELLQETEAILDMSNKFLINLHHNLVTYCDFESEKTRLNIPSSILPR